LLARDLYKISVSRYLNANEHLKNINALKAQGLVSDFDQMQAQVQVENIRPVLQQMKNFFKDAKNGLKILLNIKQSVKLQLKGELSYKKELLPNEGKIIERAVQSNFDLKNLKIKNQLDEEFAAIDRGDYWPTIKAFGNYSFAGNSNNFDFRNFHSATIGVTFSINLFQGNRTKHKVQQDEIIRLQTKEQISTLRDATISQAKSKLNDLKRVQSQIDAMNRNISVAARAYQIANDRYKQGIGSELEIKDANLALSQAKINYSNAVHDYLIAKAELENLLGNVNEKYIAVYSSYLEK